MCYYHMMKKVRENVAKISDMDLRELFISQIQLLQKSMNVDQFFKGLLVFIVSF